MRITAIVALALLAVACNPRGDRSSPPESSQPTLVRSAPAVPPEPGIYYAFRVPRALDELEAEVCFRGAPPKWLAAPTGAAVPFLAGAEHRGVALAVSEGAITLEGVGDGDCLSYRVAIAALLEEGREGARRAGDDALLSPDWWLWKPEPLGARPIRARFTGDLAAVVPWPEEQVAGFSHRIPPSSFVWKAQAAFGTFATRALTPKGGRLDVYLFGEGFGDRTERVVQWVDRSADAAASLLGRFPTRRAQLLLVPSERRGVFGYVVRGGGPAVTLLMDGEPEDDDLDWVAVHELLHLVLPPMPSEDAWLFEGLITYLAAVARARSGMISEENGWWELLDGFERGARAGTGKTTREESRRMHQTRAYWRVYWAGAAMALEWDVRLRRQGSSLAHVLADLVAAELDQSRRWEATELVKKLDAICACAVFSEVVATHLDEVTFPDTTALLRSLGVAIASGESATFDERAPDAAIRRAIMAPPS